MTILVTGGAGYIGSHTVKALQQAGHTVVVFDSFEKSSPDRIASLLPPQCIIQGTLLHPAEIKTALAAFPIEAVIHFAAYIEAGESVKDPGRFFVNNTVGTINLVNAMQELAIHHLVFSSTAAVYGQPEEVPIKESTFKAPTNPYGTSKYVAEQILADFTRYTPLQATALRYFNACGADPDGQLGEQHTPETHLIPLVLQAASGQHDHIKIFGTDYPTPDGTAVRDYIHVTDLADAHVKALEAQLQKNTPSFETYNVGTGQGYSVKEIITQCRLTTGQPIPAQEEPRRPGDPAELVADATKIKNELGWAPHYSDLATIMQTAWEWHRKQARAST